MPQSSEGVLIFVGAIFLMIGILGGGFEVSAIKIPSVGRYVRMISAGIGIILLGISLTTYIRPLMPAQPDAAVETALPATTAVPPGVAGNQPADTPASAEAPALPATTAVPPGVAGNQPADTPASAEAPAPPGPNLLGAVLFEEDFEDDDALAMTYIEEGNWQRVVEATGNGIYDIDNLARSGYPQMRFGSDVWEDYAVEFRARIVEFTTPRVAMVVCNFRLQGGGAGTPSACIPRPPPTRSRWDTTSNPHSPM